MNKKIREIDITAFRAYKDAQKFDFIHETSGNVADLVVIYAPNGYGKTSFFDAVEWAITGTVERLNTGKPVKEEVKKEEDYILKNREASEDCGNVTIISEDNEIYSINTKKKTGKMKGDFKPGELVKISPELQTILDEKESFCTTNLLAHDKITGFLQNYTAEGKTSELRVLWDENNYSEILEVINELYYELERKKRQLSAEILNQEKELKGYTYENDQSNKVISLLSNYETRYDKHFMKGTTFEIEKMLLLFNQFHEESQNEMEKKERECNNSEILLKDYQTFSDNQNKIYLLKKNKEEYDKAISTWDKIEQIKTKREKIGKELEQISDSLSKLDEFYTHVDKINSNIGDLRNIEKQKINCQREQISVTERIRELNEKLQYHNASIEKLEGKEEQLVRDYSEYNSNKLKKKKYERLNKKAKIILEQRNKRIHEWTLYIDQIDLFLSGRLGIGLLYNVFPDDIILKYRSLEKLKTERKLLIANINTLEDSRKKIIGLFDKIQQLSIKGRDIIIEQNLRECPLCHKEYQNYEELLDKISVATKENIELERIDEQIKKNKAREWEIDKEQKKLAEEVETQVVAISNEYQAKYLKESKKVNKLQIGIEMWEKIESTAACHCSQLEEKYQQEKIDISIYTQVHIYEMSIKKEKAVIKESIENLLACIKEHKIKEKELERNMKAYELKILAIEEENHEISTNDLYIGVKRYLEDKEFYNPEYDYNEMRLIVETEYSQLSKQKSIYDKELSNYCMKNMDTRDEYVLKLEECQKEINKLQVDITDYLLRCENLIGVVTEEELLEHIKIFNERLQKCLKHIGERIQSETTILVALNSLKEQKMWMSIKESLKSNNAELTLLSKRINKLQKSKDYVEDYIADKTNEYFNSDIINQIYNRIDPHPTMKHIKFLAQKDSEGVKTRIYTYDESESNKMSPVVYLSSAQVNILSLCIFMSKVLSEKNTTFNTIFIDDPIQHLDGINLLSFIDVLRTITTDLGRQIVISTHNEQFYKLLRVKMDQQYYSSKFIELTSTGRVKV